MNIATDPMREDAYIKTRYESVDGIIYMMAPPSYRHNRIGGNLYRLIGNYLWRKKCIVVYETRVRLAENIYFVPDLAVVCDKSKIKEDGIHGAPDFVAEILSPSTQKRDIGIKKEIYEKFGVGEYWIIHPLEKSIEVYILSDGKYVLDEVYTDFSPAAWDMLTDEEKAAQKLSLKLSLYDDFVIDIKDIFAD